jgi:hypothetical protein
MLKVIVLQSDINSKVNERVNVRVFRCVFLNLNPKAF